jgi:hypothetical protein
MTFLYPVTLPTPPDVTADRWSSFIQTTAREFFDLNCRSSEFASVCFMLMPKPAAGLPLVAIEDDYDDENELMHQIGSLLKSAPPADPPPTRDGHIVVAWPFACCDTTHRDFVMALLREIARVTGAVAASTISECWLRHDLNAPRGTGEDSLMAITERRGHDTEVTVARIQGPAHARTLEAWTTIAGVMKNAYAGILSDDEDAPPGFTRINVNTVGEA